MRLRALILVSVLLATVLQVAATSAQDDQTYTLFLPQLEATPRFIETFDLDPASPTPFSSPRWDIYVHERQPEHLYNLHSMHEAGHGPNCEPPPATHVTSSYERSVYLCRKHMMTALDSADPGYSLIYLTPDRLVDFDGRQAAISWDISTLVGGPRDWWDVWISPYEDHLVAPLEDWLPDLNGPPRRAVHVKFAPLHYYLEATVYHDYAATPVNHISFQGYNTLIAPSATQRMTFQIVITQDRLRVGMPALGLWWIDAPLSLDWSEGVVQFGHHSYTPHKDNGRPNTWHWDNFNISPVKPFDMIRAGHRYADATQPRLTFAEPAPAGGMLRFSATGKIEVSFDDGVTWQPAAPQRQASSSEDRFRTFWLPVPEGATRASFRGVDPFYGSWHVRNASIWSR